MSNQPLLNRIANDWAPPRLVRAVRRSRDAAQATPAPKQQPKRTSTVELIEEAPVAAPTEDATPDTPVARVPDDPRWARLTERVLAELRECDEIYRPTNFWGPGLEQLLADLAGSGLADFKRWPTAGFWFLPAYGQGFSLPEKRQLFRRARVVKPSVSRSFLFGAIDGVHQAVRDYDAARLAWDQARWPADLEGIGESELGNPWQRLALSPVEGVGFGRAYLNYLLMMAALSRHIDAPPRSVLEIGGGFGALGEIVLARDPDARYVNLDIPPLVTVSSWYLTELFGHDRVLTYDDTQPATGPLRVPGSAVLPNYRLGDLEGSFEVFANSFSFQEMEPAVVEHYAAEVSRLGVEWVVSLNSRLGKPKVSDGHEIGVVDPVTSARIVEIFGRHGFELQGAYGRPLVSSAGELVVLRRRTSAG